MRHALTADGRAFRLRPVEIGDAAFIVALRNDPGRNSFLSPTSTDVKKQEEWIRNYLETPDDYYWVIESNITGEPEGTVGIYNYSKGLNRAQWGRWIVRSNSKSALPSVALSFELAFGRLSLGAIHAYTASENRGVHSILKRFGMLEKRRLAGRLAGDPADEVIEYEVTRASWMQMQR